MALDTGKARDSPSPSSSSKTRPLRILDLCTGTGCIALLLHALLASQFQRLQVMGIDLSPVALSLARRNLEHNISLDVLDRRAREEITFHRGDVLARSTDTRDSASTIPTVEDLLSQQTIQSALEPRDGYDTPPLPKIDLLISNPPYISPSDFRNGTTARSVRLFEPRLALVPPINTNANANANANATGPGENPEDIFYRRILGLSLDVRASLTVLECGDKMQAERVVEMFRVMRRSLGGDSVGEGFTVEIWPRAEEDCRANGFHLTDGSRCVIIRKGIEIGVDDELE